MTDEELLDHCRRVTYAIGERDVIPFLGAVVNTYDRAEDLAGWYERDKLPSSSELTDRLVKRYSYPLRGPCQPGLVNVAQFIDVLEGPNGLDKELRSTFARKYEPSPLLRFLAEQRYGARSAWKLLVTTNYDDALEQAFRDAGVEFDIVYYWAKPNRPGKFKHVTHDGKLETIKDHTGPFRFNPSRRPVILKIHGTVDRARERNDCYVISENDYIAYLAGDLEKLLPSNIARVMRASRFLFLGYSLSDWNLRVMLFHHVWARHRDLRSWAIQPEPSKIDVKFWEHKKIELVETDLTSWTEAMIDAVGT
jgi:hypothetical protein